MNENYGTLEVPNDAMVEEIWILASSYQVTVNFTGSLKVNKYFAVLITRKNRNLLQRKIFPSFALMDIYNFPFIS